MHHITSSLTPLDPDVERDALSLAPTPDNYHSIAARVAALNEIEVVPPVSVKRDRTGTVRIAAWNLERCKFLSQSAALLHRTGADVALLSEMDYGMVRSGNFNTTSKLAELLGYGYAFAVEFVELGIGNTQEIIHFEGQENKSAFHGNAVLSRYAFRDPQVIQVGDAGSWFSHTWHHRRLGSRIGLSMTIDFAGKPVTMISTHLENLSTPDERAAQINRILEHLTANPLTPVVIAGDMNTAALPHPDLSGDWFLHPGRFEPLFDRLRAAGFEWLSTNTPQSTRRIINDGRPLPLQRRIDWIFVRGLRASNPLTWAAEGADGTVLSDHELLTVDINLL